MERGWNIQGRLIPLWSRLPGKRDELANLTGITPQTLSSYNSGARAIGMRNATRIAQAFEDALDIPTHETLESLGILEAADNPVDVPILTQIVTLLEADPTAAAGHLAPALLVLADELAQLSFRLRQAVARQGERWHLG